MSAGDGPSMGAGRREAIQSGVDRWQVRRLALRVLLVQVIALAALGALQAWFGGP